MDRDREMGWTVATRAQRHHAGRTGVSIEPRHDVMRVTAVDEAGAVAAALERARARWPESEGWRDHAAYAHPSPEAGGPT